MSTSVGMLHTIGFMKKSVSFYCLLMNTSIDSNYFAMVIESHNNIYHRAVHKCRREAKI